MPKMLNMTEIFEVNTSVPLDVNLPVLEAQGIQLYGKIARYPKIIYIRNSFYPTNPFHAVCNSPI